MTWTVDSFLGRIGLWRQKPQESGSRVIVLDGAASDSQSGLTVNLTSTTELDDAGRPSDLTMQYWRHLPHGQSLSQSLIRMSFSPAGEDSRSIQPDEIWVQAVKVFDRARGDSLDDPETRKNVSRVLESVNRLNTHLREKGPVENTAKILDECYIKDVIKESVVVRGLNAKKGGFDFSLSGHFLKMAGQKSGALLTMKNMDRDRLRSVLGFRRNTLEPDKDFSASREVHATNPQSGVAYAAGVRLEESADRLMMELYIRPEDAPADIDPKAVPDLVRLEFMRDGDDHTWRAVDARFMGEKIEPGDLQGTLRLIGIAQACNRQLADWKYPSFMDKAAEFDLLDMVSPLSLPPSLEKQGGEFLYGSLHGTGFEKKIENFGDQIGIAGLFLHRGTKPDGRVSTAGVAVDFPFAAGGADSNYDGAIPDYLPFWKDIKAFCITHDHFDHCDGLPFYAAKGLMKDKTVYCTDRVKYFLDKKMDSLRVPRTHRPKISIVKGAGAIPVTDEDGVVRLWIQHEENATIHSALCTPYLVSACYGDDHYKGSALVYGDSRGLTSRAVEFFKSGTRLLPEQAKASGRTVTPEKVNRDITMALHDLTAVRYEGHSPEPAEVEENLNTAMGWFADKGVLMSPISTNNAEYTAALNVASRTGRNVTAVGRNAELRLSCMNMFGVLPDINLRSVEIDPMKDRKKQKVDRLIPETVMKDYLAALKADKNIGADESEESRERKIQKAHEERLKDYRGKLPPDQRTHEDDVNYYMLKSLLERGKIVFENDVNGYFMWKAVMDRQQSSSLRAGRTSTMARDFRQDPKSLMIFVTGTQGNAEEKQSTLQKFANFFSLLDADESVRNTGFRVKAEDYVVVITQPAIPGNEAGQESLINDLVRSRGITVVGAFLNGFKIYNPGARREVIAGDLERRGWRHEFDSQGNIRVYGHPIHVHGHGFRQDLVNIARSVPAEFHEAHHVPDHDSYDIFRALMAEKRMKHSGARPDDFQFFRIDANAPTDTQKFEKAAQINPSYILIRQVRKYGQMYGGFMEWMRATLLRREGHNREDGLAVRTENDGAFRRVTAQIDWESVSNPAKRDIYARERKLGPSRVDRDSGWRRPHSRPIFSAPLPEPEAA